MQVKTGYTFDDLLLVPKYSEVSSRQKVDISVNLGKDVLLHMPLVSANMKSVTEVEMAKKMILLGGLALFHRFGSDDSQIKFFKESASSYVGERIASNHVGCSVGIQESDKLLTDKLIAIGCKIICVDVAHGDHIGCNQMTSWIAKKYPEVLIISGNVASKSGALRLYNSGAHVIKVGIGGGSLCTTRIETGNGVPQLTALEEVYEASKVYEEKVLTDENYDYSPYRSSVFNGERKFKIIADGGIRRAGDIVKALCFADTVMLGNLLAGTDETPGWADQGTNGKKFKEYAGSSTHKSNHVEGVIAKVPCKGPVTPIINKLLEGLRSGCSYQGADNLEELKISPEFVSITNAGLKESHPHAESL